MTFSILLVFLLWCDCAFASALFDKGPTVFYIRRVPIKKSGDVSGVKVSRGTQTIQIDPFATQLCAISTQSFAAAPVIPEQENCTGYIPLAQEAGLDEQDGRLYVFLYTDVRGPQRAQMVESWDAYMSRFRYPKILEIPIRGDRMYNFITRRIPYLQGIEKEMQSNLLKDHLGVPADGVQVPEDVRSFRYAFAKQWHGLSYIYAESLKQQGIQSRSLQDRMKSSEPFSAIEKLKKAILSGLDMTLPVWNSDTPFCQDPDRSDRWDKIQFPPASPEEIAHEYYTLFMDAVVWPWLCETYTVAKKGAPFGEYIHRDPVKDVEHRLGTYVQAIQEAKQNDKYLKRFLSRPPNVFGGDAAKFWVSTLFENILAGLQRKVKEGDFTAYAFIEVLRVENELQRYAQMRRKYTGVIDQLPPSSGERQQVFMAPAFLSRWIQGEAELEAFSETSIDSYVEQMRQRVLAQDQRLVLTQSMRDVYDQAQAFFDINAQEQVRDTTFGAEITIPQPLAQLRRIVMQYIHGFVRTVGIHHALHQKFVHRFFNLQTVMGILFGETQVHPDIPERWVTDVPQAQKDEWVKKILGDWRKNGLPGDKNVDSQNLKNVKPADFKKSLQRKFQQLDWLVVMYRSLLDGQILALLEPGAHFEKHPGLGRIIVRAQVSQPRRIFFAQEKSLVPFSVVTHDRSSWKQLDQVYAQVSSCASDHWCMMWRPNAFSKVVNSPQPTEISPSVVGMPGYVSDVKVEEIPSATPTRFAFRVTSKSRSPDRGTVVIFEQTFFVNEVHGQYQMTTQFSFSTSDSTQFVSGPLPFSYPELYGNPQLYVTSQPGGFDLLMRDFVNGFPIHQVFEKRWQPFSHVHQWSKDSQKVVLNIGGLVLVFDLKKGLIFRSDGPDSMGTRYLRAGMDPEWHHHPYDTFAYGQFAGVLPAAHYNYLEFTQPGYSAITGTASWLWDSVWNLNIRTGSGYVSSYDDAQQAFVIKRRNTFAYGSHEDVAVDASDFRSPIPAVKVMPTMPYHMAYTPVGSDYAQRLDKLAFVRNLTVSPNTDMLELLQQPNLDTIFSPDGKDVWMLSHVLEDVAYKAPSRTYISHIDLRSTQRHPHLVNFVSHAEAEGKRSFPGFSEWMGQTWDELWGKKCGDSSDQACLVDQREMGVMKGLWLSIRRSVNTDLEAILKDVPFYRYNPRIRAVSIGKNEGVFLVTAFPHEYEQMKVSSWGMLSQSYWSKWAEEVQHGELKDRYRQYLMYVKWNMNDDGREIGKPGLEILGRRFYELRNQVWGKVLDSANEVPVPDMHLIDGMVMVGGP